MFRNIFAFEMKYRLMTIPTLVVFLLFLLFGFISVYRASDASGLMTSITGAGRGNIHANAPYALHMMVILFTNFGLLITAAFFGGAAYRDFKANTYGLYFSYPITKIGYLSGRFAGAYCRTLLVMSGVGLGMLLGSLSPWTNMEKMAPLNILDYLHPYVVGVMPNLLFAGALLFAIALLTRRFMPVYAGLVIIVVGYLTGTALLGSENRMLASLIDPFGQIAAGQNIAYWSIAEKNRLVIPLAGSFLYNRIFWTTLGLGILVFAYRRFRFTHLSTSKVRHKVSSSPTDRSPQTRELFAGPIPTPEYGFPDVLKRMLYTSMVEFRMMMKNNTFRIIFALGMVLILVLGFKNVGLVRGTQTFPVTSQVLDTTKDALYLLCLAIAMFGSGELVWRERNRRTDAIYDALPVPEWVPLLGKLGALMLVQACLMLATMICGMIIQVLHGYTHFEPELYLQELFGIRLVYYVFLSVIAMFVQVLVNRKFVGYVVTLLLVDDLLVSLGLMHHLWTFGTTPHYAYSDMNGYGPFLQSIVFYNLYWTALSVLLAVISLLFWVRGVDARWKDRIRLMSERMTRGKTVTALAALTGCCVFGAVVVYNTTILNRFETAESIEEIHAEYEKKFKPYEALPQPRVLSIQTTVDMYPGERWIDARGTMALVNETDSTISDIFIQVPRETGIEKMSLSVPHSLKTLDDDHGVYVYALHDPMKSGEAIALEFDIVCREKGFKDRGVNTRLIRNGTFLSVEQLLPAVGYDPYFLHELDDNDKRKKYGLPPKPRIPSIDDEGARMETPLGRDACWIDFEAVVSTSSDQVALTCGELTEEWKEGGRRFFHYKTHDKILRYFPFISARYRVKRERHRDVAIEVYYHPDHDVNVDLMIEAAGKSLNYFTEHFGPYQFRHLRIVEFPRYAIFAEGFPGLIPISEGYGFIAKYDEDKVKEVFRVVAHEVAHQWWGHQVIGANVQGFFMLTEVMAQYSALMVCREEYEQEKIRRYVANEIDRYFRGRGREAEEETPLILTNERTWYLNYAKGFAVMNALQAYLGEERVNIAVGKYIETVAFQEPPFTTSCELIEAFREVTPDSLRYLLTDMFETITLYENRAVEALGRKLANGRYAVKVSYSVKKFRADAWGNETPVPFDDLIAFGVFDDEGKELALTKHWIDSETGELEFEVDRKPARAGIDPYYYLIDKRTDDNVIDVREKVMKKNEIGKIHDSPISRNAIGSPDCPGDDSGFGDGRGDRPGPALHHYSG
jgi:ABC-2 type transport system permease protein